MSVGVQVGPENSESSGGGGGDYTGYILGITADNGVTDNTAAILSYLQSLSGGSGPLVLPPGQIGVNFDGVTNYIPQYCTLRGSGRVQYKASSTEPNATELVPVNGSGQSVVVNLTKNLSSLQDLVVNAKYSSDPNEVADGVIFGAQGNTLRNVSIFGGTSHSLSSTSSAVECLISDVYLKPVSGGLTLNAQGDDWQVTNLIASSGKAILNSAGTTYVNCHWVSNATGSDNCLIDDHGVRQIFVGNNFDSTGPSATTLIDRSNAGFWSVYSACRFVQSTTNITGIPVFAETATAGAGVRVNNCAMGALATGSSFTSFITNSLGSTYVDGLDIPTSSYFTLAIGGTPVGIFKNITIGDVVQLIKAGHVNLSGTSSAFTAGTEVPALLSSSTLQPGIYRMSFNVTFLASTTGGNLEATLVVTSGTATGMGSAQGVVPISGQLSLSWTGIVTITAAAVLSISVYPDTGTTGTVARASTTHQTYPGATQISWETI